MDTNYLHDAAVAFKSLLYTEYHIILGKKQKSKELCLRFSSDNFYHLAGLQKLKNTYKFQKMAYSKVFKEILKGKISDATIIEDKAFLNIVPRILALSKLESLLDDETTEFFLYDSKRISINSSISANYVVKGQLESQPVVLTFLINNTKDNIFYVKSIFPMENYDYTKGQSLYTVLLKEKRNLKNEQSTRLFLHPNYNT